MNTDWISVEDRVPVDDDYVLAWNGQPIVAYYDGEWYSNDGNFDEDISPITYWMPILKELEELDFSTPKKVVGNLISANVLDEIAEEIEKCKKRQLEIALGINDLDERRLHLHIEVAFAYCLEIINKYRKENV